MSDQKKKHRRLSGAYENPARPRAESSRPQFTRIPPKVQVAHRILGPLIRLASRLGHTAIEQALLGLYEYWVSADEEIDYAERYD